MDTTTCNLDCDSPIDAFFHFVAVTFNWMVANPEGTGLMILVFVVFSYVVAYKMGISKGKKSCKNEMKIAVKDGYEIDKIGVKEKK